MAFKINSQLHVPASLNTADVTLGKLNLNVPDFPQIKVSLCLMILLCCLIH